ncbi:MAG TPA: ProQ/FinO family protein [Terriglobales bacterium]|nr:ProQ/FinO family protein [Terriglobales bacterium]
MVNSKERRVKQADDLITVLADLWPHAFSVFERDRKPLRLGIHHDILAAAKGAISPDELKIALRFYCANGRYLRACVEGAARIDLDGEAAGSVSADEAAHAGQRLAQYRARRSKPAPTASKPVKPIKRPITLADLRASAAARKAAS